MVFPPAVRARSASGGALAPTRSRRAHRNVLPSIERLDQLEERAVRILEAEELRAGSALAELHRDRLRHHVDALGLQPLILFIDVLGEQGYTGGAGMVQMGIRTAFGGRLFPFDQIDPGRARIVAEREQRRPGAAVRDIETLVVGAVGALADIKYDLKAEHLVELERALEVRDVHVDMKNRFDHRPSPPVAPRP